MRFSLLSAARWLCTFAFAFGACAHDSELECKDLSSPCDIAKSECQREIFVATACMRGQLHARMPPIRTISRDQYAAELMDQASADDDFGQRAWGHALGLFGLVPTEQSFEQADISQRVATIAAYYQRDTKKVTVISDSDMTDKQGTLTLSHEFVHALQDQRQDLAKFYDKYATTSDALLALRCLTEGEAVALSNLTMPDVVIKDPNSLDWDGYFGRWLSGVLDDVAASSAPLLDARSLPYPMGGRGVINVFLTEGLDGVQRLYQAPPSTLRSWTEDPPAVAKPDDMDCGPPDAPENYERRYFDRQGMAALLSLYVATGQGAPFDDAQAWSSDWFAVYTQKDERSDDVAVAWRLRFDSEDAASAFFDRLSSTDRALDAQLYGQEILLAAAATDSLLSDWDRSAGCDADKSRRKPALDYQPPPWLGRSVDAQHPVRWLRRGIFP